MVLSSKAKTPLNLVMAAIDMFVYKTALKLKVEMEVLCIFWLYNVVKLFINVILTIIYIHLMVKGYVLFIFWFPIVHKRKNQTASKLV